MSQGIPLDQLAAMKMQQQSAKAQMSLNIALQLFIGGKAESIPDAFTIAERFIQETERRYGNKQP